MPTKNPAAKTSKPNSVEPVVSKDNTLPAYLKNNTPVGNELVTTDCLATPTIKLLQALSPEVQSKDGAKPGMLYNSVSGDLYASIHVINLFFEKKFAVFKERSLGGGLFGNFETADQATDYMNTLPGNASDYEVIETDNHYLLVLDGQNRPITAAQIYMDSSKLKVSKQWNADIQLKAPNADRFASIWNLSSEKTRNRAGQEYFVFSREFIGWAPQSLYQEAKTLYEDFFRQSREQTNQVTGGTPAQDAA